MINKYTQIPISDKTLRKAIYNVHRGRCFYTGRNIDFKDMRIDHIKPKTLGGEDSIINYVLCCYEINIMKFNHYNEQFGAIVREINDLLFTEKVVSEYINIELNNGELKGKYPIDKYCKKAKISIENKRKMIALLKKESKILTTNLITLKGKISNKKILIADYKEIKMAHKAVCKNKI